MEFAVIAVIAVLAVGLGVTVIVIRAARGSAANEPTRRPSEPDALDREQVAATQAQPADLAPTSERVANRDYPG